MTRSILRIFQAAALAAVAAGCMGDTRPKVVIEWGAYPEEFEGKTVEIDGKPAGELKKFGEATRTAFLVDKGNHLVRVVHPGFDCPPVKVAAELSGQRIMLLLEVGEMMSTTGKPQLTLRR